MKRTSLFALITIMGVSGSGALGQELFVAGTDPSQRPAGAPVITQVAKDGAWYQLALTGLSQPYPASLRFLEDQGRWFNPFVHPGMKGPYDIRGWHDQP